MNCCLVYLRINLIIFEILQSHVLDSFFEGRLVTNIDYSSDLLSYIAQLVVSRESDLRSVPFNRPVGVKCREQNTMPSAL